MQILESLSAGVQRLLLSCVSSWRHLCARHIGCQAACELNETYLNVTAEHTTADER